MKKFNSATDPAHVKIQDLFGLMYEQNDKLSNSQFYIIKNCLSILSEAWAKGLQPHGEGYIREKLDKLNDIIKEWEQHK